MEPYYQHADITIYFGDCRDVLPQLEPADLLIADPPYGIGWQGRGGNHELITGDDGSLSVASWLPLALRAIRRGRHAYIFGMSRRDVPEDAPMSGFADLIWDKRIMGLGNLAIPWGPAHEPILFGVQEISKANRAKNAGIGAARLRKGSVIRVQRPHSAQTLRHPTEKPVKLLRILIESSSTFDEVVLDPFMGGGSTLVAAQREQRGAIGIEIEERYCEIAVKRLEADG